MKNFKKLVSVILALVLAFSAFSIVTVAADKTEVAAISDANEINFDVNSTDWANFKKVFCHIWEYGNESFYAWQSKAEACKDEDKDGIWTYDLEAKGVFLESDKLYVVIFSNDNNLQTYNLLLGAECIGDTAYCDGTMYENPQDSSKKALAAFWRNQDASVYGPEKCVTSIGNVVGVCIPSTTTAQAMLEDFLLNTLANARTYSGKDDQALIDDTARALGLKKDNVSQAISDTGVDTNWKQNKSTLTDGYVYFPSTDDELPPQHGDPSTPDQSLDEDIFVAPVEPDYPDVPKYPMIDSNVIHFDTNDTGWVNFEKVFCHIWVYGGEAFYAWQAKKERCIDDDGDGVWTYDLKANGIAIEQGVVYAVVFSNENGSQTYNLLFDSTVLGDTACCDGTLYDSLDDSLRNVSIAYWSNQDANKYGPEKIVNSIGEVKGTCVPPTTTPAQMLREFIKEHLEYTRDYTGKTDQQIIDEVGAKLNLTQEGAFAAVVTSGEFVYWDIFESTLPNGSFLDYNLIGDVDGDGAVSIMDATEIQMVLAQMKDWVSVSSHLYADADGDGTVSIMDATEIQMSLAGLRLSLFIK